MPTPQRSTVDARLPYLVPFQQSLPVLGCFLGGKFLSCSFSAATKLLGTHLRTFPLHTARYFLLSTLDARYLDIMV